MQEAYREQNAMGLTICHEGKLTLYPAAFDVEFRRWFLENSLAPEAVFQQWAADYYDEEGREWSRLP